MQVTSEVQMALESLTLRCGKIPHLTIATDGDGETVGVQVIGDPLSTAYEHGRGRVGCDQDQNAVDASWSFARSIAVGGRLLKSGRVVVHLADFNFMRGLAEGQLTQSDQCRLLKEMLQRLFRFIGGIND